MPEGAKAGEKIFFFRAEDFGDRLALAADDGKIGLRDPEEPVEQALAVENLAGGDGEDPARGVGDGLFAAVAGGVERELFLRQEQRLDFAEVAEVLVGEDEAGERGARFADRAFGSFAGWGEDDLAGFDILAGLAAVFGEFFDADVLAVEVLGAGGFAGRFAFGDLAGEAGRRVGGEADGGY